MDSCKPGGGWRTVEGHDGVEDKLRGKRREREAAAQQL